MKVRCGFVSNSSSSSFVIRLSDLTAQQLNDIVEHTSRGVEMGLENAEHIEDAWFIEIKNGMVTGSTNMDNFSMSEYFERVGIPESIVKWY